MAINKNASGGPLNVNGKPQTNGIGTHSNSLIHFELPTAYTKFTAKGALDLGGTSQGTGTSVVFAVYTEKPKSVGGTNQAITGSHDPKEAVANLDTREGLKTTLVASEPTIFSPAANTGEIVCPFCGPDV